MVKERRAKPFLFLFTGEEFLRGNKVEFLLDQLLPRELHATNLFRFYPDDLSWPPILSQAATPSLMGGAQVFWVARVDRLKKVDFEPFASYCSHPASQTYFIFEADELPSSHPLLKLARTFGEHVHIERHAKEEGLNLMRAKLKRFGKTMTPGAWQTLEERLGGSGRLMDMALDQLMLYSEGPAIDEEAVGKLAHAFLHYEPFDLTEALVQKDTDQALKIFHFFYEMNADITMIVGLLHWQLKRIWQAKKLLARGANPSDIARMVRIPPFRLDSFLSQVRRFDLEALERLLDLLWKMDWDAKRGATEESVAMEAFLATAAG
ncbi:MAG: DNA polymerase III subunit delta [Candidatus Omnitrophica bacterium]|nr:DNA polymerase III subunit delta [Candidatus Omnitrophota bacterium]